MTAGRPTDYTPEIADTVCARLAEGESMRAISRDDSMPCMTSLFKWLRMHDEFAQQYAKAKEQSTDALFEDLLDIADDDTKDVQRARLQVDVRKWALSKLKPKKYGDKMQQEVTGADGGPLEVLLREISGRTLGPRQ